MLLALSVAWDAVLVTDPVALFLEQGRAQWDSFPVKFEDHKVTGNIFPPTPQPVASQRAFPAPPCCLINFNKLIGFISSPVSTRIQGCAWVTPLPCTGRSFKVTPLMQQGKHNLPVRNNTEGNKCSCCFGETRRFSFPITFRNNKCHGRTEVSWSCVDLRLLWGANRN